VQANAPRFSPTQLPGSVNHDELDNFSPQKPYDDLGDRKRHKDSEGNVKYELHDKGHKIKDGAAAHLDDDVARQGSGGFIGHRASPKIRVTIAEDETEANTPKSGRKSPVRRRVDGKKNAPPGSPAGRRKFSLPQLSLSMMLSKGGQTPSSPSAALLSPSKKVKKASYRFMMMGSQLSGFSINSGSLIPALKPATHSGTSRRASVQGLEVMTARRSSLIRHI
jgi:hypothetical protein